MKWNESIEIELLRLKDIEKKTFVEISNIIGTTTSSVKHKYIRLKQKVNDDKHHHPVQKIEQIKKILQDKRDIRILETNAGFGNLTKVYSEYGMVTAQDIDQIRIDALNQMDSQNIVVNKCDSFIELHKHIYTKQKFDVIDLDPYGFPSRYFPHIFEIIDNGVLFVTFPKMGVQQINKITIEHYRIFWAISLADKESYTEKVVSKIKDYGLQCKRHVELIENLELDRMYRMAFMVRKESMLNLVGLSVIRNGKKEEVDTNENRNAFG